MKQKLLIIDGHNFLFKSYSVPFKFYTKKGTPLHVTTTFLSLIKRAIKVTGCSQIAVVFDREEITSNHIIYKDYKANRKTDYSQDKDSPFMHLPHVKKVLKHLKIKTYEKKGIEADDLIASLTKQFLKTHKNGQVFIASNDSDFYQIVSKNVFQLILGKKGVNTFIAPKDIKLKLGITPKQYVYFKSLTGDKSDNIKGIPKIGSICASQIINKKLKMDLKDYSTLIQKNKKLIALNSELNICKNVNLLNLNSKILSVNNQEIFIKLRF